MASRKKFTIDSFKGGLVSGYSNNNIGPTSFNQLEEFPVIDNYGHSLRGSIEKRPGFKNKLITNQQLLDYGLTQVEIDDNNFNADLYIGSFDAYFNFEAKGFYEDGSGNYDEPEPVDDTYNIKLGIINGNLIVLNFEDSISDIDGKLIMFPTRIISSGFNVGTNIETVQFGDELFIATGDGYFVLRLIRKYIDSNMYYLETRRMDSTDEIYYPDGNEYQTIGKNVLFPVGMLDIEDDFSSAFGESVKGIRANPEQGTIGKNVNIIPYIQTVNAGPEKTGLYWNIDIKDANGETIYSYPSSINYSNLPTDTSDFFLIDMLGYTGIIDKKYELRYNGTIPAGESQSISCDLYIDDVFENSYTFTDQNTAYEVYAGMYIFESSWVTLPDGVRAKIKRNFQEVAYTETYYKVIIVDQTLFDPELNIIFDKVGTYTITYKYSLDAPVNEYYPNTRTTQFVVNEIDYDASLSSLNTKINQCTKILLYYNRIILYGNGTGEWYKSHINKPNYFIAYSMHDYAATNSESTKEVLQKVTTYRNALVALTKKSIFLVTGVGDVTEDISGDFSPFRYYKVSNKGTIAPETVCKNDNNLLFLSDDGVYALDTIYVDEKKANLYKVSKKLNPLVITKDSNANAVVYKGVYYINFPSKKYTLKWEYEYGRIVEGVSMPLSAWSRDISTELTFKKSMIIDDELHSIKDGKLMVMNNQEQILYRESLNIAADYTMELDEFEIETGNYLYTGYLSYRPIVLGSINITLNDGTGEYVIVDDGDFAFELNGRLVSATVSYYTGLYEIVVSEVLTQTITVSYEFDFDYSEYSFPIGYFTDDGIIYEAILETKGYEFENGEMLKKVKQIIAETSGGSFSLMYYSSADLIIDLFDEPGIIVDPELGRMTSYTERLETNMFVSENFTLGSEDLGILGVNRLGDVNEFYQYINLPKSTFSNAHKIIIINAEDSYAKILGFTFVYILGKLPR